MVAIEYGLPGNKNWPQPPFKTADFMGPEKATRKCDTLPMIFEIIKYISVPKKNTPKLSKTTLKWMIRGAKMVAISYGLPGNKKWPRLPFKTVDLMDSKRLSKYVTHYP